MKMTLALSLVSLFVGANAMADFKLSQTQKAVVCYGEDNQDIKLDAKRTKMKYTIEGESAGSLKIVDVKTDNQTFVTYATSEFTLTLSNQGDTFFYFGDQEPSPVRCK